MAHWSITDPEQSPTPGPAGYNEPPPLPDSPVAEAVDRARTMLSTRVRNDPYATIGIAAGLGLLVGGGMWRLFARSLLGLGTRVAISTVVTSLIDRTSNHQRQE